MSAQARASRPSRHSRCEVRAQSVTLSCSATLCQRSSVSSDHRGSIAPRAEERVQAEGIKTQGRRLIGRGPQLSMCTSANQGALHRRHSIEAAHALAILAQTPPRLRPEQISPGARQLLFACLNQSWHPLGNKSDSSSKRLQRIRSARWKLMRITFISLSILRRSTESRVSLSTLQSNSSP